MDWKFEVVVMPVSDVDRAKAIYADQVGFVVDVDQQFGESFRVLQLTPRGSGCSITIGKGLTGAEPPSNAAGAGPVGRKRRWVSVTARQPGAPRDPQRPCARGGGRGVRPAVADGRCRVRRVRGLPDLGPPRHPAGGARPGVFPSGPAQSRGADTP